MAKLTHLDDKGQARMVDVADKEVSRRHAVASSRIAMSPDAFAALVDGRLVKGEAFAVARLAGIQAAKRTAELIPLCHQIPLSSVSLTFTPRSEDHSVAIRAEAATVDRTGVEMEALVAATVAALTIYDMCKAIDKAMVLQETVLLEKSGGRSGDYRRDDIGTSS